MLIQTPDDFAQLKSALNSATLIGCDTETRKTADWLERTIMGISFSVEKGRSYESFYYPIDHRSTVDKEVNLPVDWLDDLPWEDPDKLWVFHNARFDLHKLEEIGIHIPLKNVEDTMLLAYIHNENEYSYELDSLGLKVGMKKVPTKDVENAFGWDYIPRLIFEIYANQDTTIPLALYRLYAPQIHRDGLWDVYRWTVDVMDALRRVEACGIVIDYDEARRLSEAAEADLSALRAHLGCDPMREQDLLRILYGVPTEGGLALPVLARSPKTSKPLVNEQVLSRYAQEYPLAKPVVESVLAYRGTLKLKSTYYDRFIRETDSSGRVHPQFKQHGTRTGRLSSNYQQIPRDSPVKGLFKAPFGYQLWELDYSQIELRTACVYAEVEEMIEAYREGIDLHDMTAKLIDSYSYFPDTEAGKGHGRYVGKTTNFLLLYGGGPDKLRNTLWVEARMDIPLSICGKWAKGFHKTYPGFKRMLNKAKRTADRRGYVKLWNGRLRRFHTGPKVSNSKDAWNAIVQGGCASIMLDAIVQIEHSGLESQVVNTVHDSIWVYIPEDKVDSEIKHLESIMRAKPEELFEIPFKVDAKRLA